MVPVEKRLRVRPLAGMWTVDPAQDIPEGTSPDMLNFQVFNGYIRKRPGYNKYQSGSSFPAAPLTGIYSAQQLTGTRALYVTNKVGVFKFNTGTLAYDAQAGPALTGNDHNLFSFEISQNNLVFSQGVDNIMALPLTGAVYAAISANAKPSKYLSRWNQRLYAAFTLEGGFAAPFRVRWPVASDHTDWVGIGSGFNDLSDDVYQVRNMRKLVDVLIVYTEKGAFVVTKTGASAGPAQYALQVKDIGLYASYTLQGRNTEHYFVGTDDMYSFNGVQFTPIATQVRNTIFAQLAPGSVANNFGVMFLGTQEYAAFIATGNNLVPDTVWVYNWGRNAVYPWSFASGIFTCATLHYLDTSVTIASLVGTIASQTWIIGAFTLTANFPILMLGASDGKVYSMVTGLLSDDGAAINCRWTSKDYTAADIDPSLAGYMVTMREVGFSYVDPGAPFTLQFSYSTDRGLTWTGPYAVTCAGGTLNAVGDAMDTHQVTGKRVRFKIENNTATELPQIQDFYPVLELRKQKIA